MCTEYRHQENKYFSSPLNVSVIIIVCMGCTVHTVILVTCPLNACVKSQSFTLYANIDIRTKWMCYVSTQITNFNFWRLVQCWRPSPRAWAPSSPILFPWRLYVWTTKHTNLSSHLVIQLDIRGLESLKPHHTHAPPHKMNAQTCKNPCHPTTIAYMPYINTIITEASLLWYSLCTIEQTP